MSLVYLCGPITGLSYNNSMDWRQYAIEYLSKHNIQGISPMRGKLYLAQETNIADSYEEHPLSSSKGITCRDRWDCQRCDIMLSNFLGAERASLGSAIEYGWADSARRPIVTVMEPKSIHDHAIIRECSGYIVHTLEHGLNLCKVLLG